MGDIAQGLPDSEVSFRFFLPDNVRQRGDMILGRTMGAEFVPRPSNEEPITFIGETKKGTKIELVMSSTNQFWRSAQTGEMADTWATMWNALADTENRDCSIVATGKLVRADSVAIREVDF